MLAYLWQRDGSTEPLTWPRHTSSRAVNPQPQTPNFNPQPLTPNTNPQPLTREALETLRNTRGAREDSRASRPTNLKLGQALATHLLHCTCQRREELPEARAMEEMRGKTHELETRTGACNGGDQRAKEPLSSSPSASASTSAAAACCCSSSSTSKTCFVKRPHPTPYTLHPTPYTLHLSSKLNPHTLATSTLYPHS